VTEDALLAAARRGDHRAFATLLDGYDRPLRALAYRVLGDRDDMDDAMQEAAVKAFTNLSSFDGRSSFGTWLHRVTYTTCLNVLRARGGTPESIDADDVGQTEIRAGTGQLSQARLADSDLAAEVSERLDLEQALRALSAHQRAVVCLVLELGFSLDQAANILDVPAGTVSSRLWHARAVLRRSLETPSGVRGDHGLE
jgi:RNA polymerase sigma-70 factor (ECF subfamily)